MCLLAIGNCFSQVDFTASQVCKGNVTTLNGTSVLNDTLIQNWLWDLDNDGSFDDAGGKTLNYVFQNEGSLTVGLKIMLKSGSQDSASKSVIVFPLPEVVYTAENVCEGNPVAFNASASIASGLIVQYKWDFNDDNQSDIVVPDSSLNFYLGQAGNYRVSLECVTDKACSSKFTREVKVFHLPDADFYTQGDLRAKDTVQFVNTTFLSNENLMTCLWNFGDTKTAFGISNISHEYDTAGIFNVSMIAISENNCADTAYQSLAIDTAATIENKGTSSAKQNLKNILTPNGDGINDMFMIEEVTQGKSCELKIFNQWNELVYSSSGYNNDWDGQGLQTGTYFYILSCGEEKKTGSINILK